MADCVRFNFQTVDKLGREENLSKCSSACHWLYTMLATVFLFYKFLYVKLFPGLFIFEWWALLLAMFSLSVVIRVGKGASFFAVFGLRGGFVGTANGLAPVWGLFGMMQGNHFYWRLVDFI